MSPTFESYSARKRRLAGETPKARQSRITLPRHSTAVARLVFELMKKHGVTYEALELRSGVLRSSTKAIRTKNAPSLSTVEGLLGALNYRFVPIPVGDALAPELCDPLVEKHGASIEHLTAYLVEQAALNRALTEDAKARIQLWREKADAEAERRHAAHEARSGRLAAPLAVAAE